MSVSHKILCQNVGKLQHNMKPFVLNLPWINNEFLLVPPTIRVIIEGTSSFQDFLSLLKFIYTAFKGVSKVTKYVCLTLKKFDNVFLHLPNFLFRPV